MTFKECYKIIKERFDTTDLSKVDNDFSGMICIENKKNTSDSGYVYLSYINGEKHIEPVKHNKANIVVSMSSEMFESVYKGQTDVFRAFTTGQIKAKGNIFLALSIYKKLKS